MPRLYETTRFCRSVILPVAGLLVAFAAGAGYWAIVWGAEPAAASQTAPAEKPAEAKPAEKPSEPAPAAAQPAQKPAEAKPQAAPSSPPAAPAQTAEPAEKPPEAKPADAKPAETKPAEKPAETKPTEAKPAEAKPAEKPAEAKAAEAKPGEAKPAEKPAEKPTQAPPPTARGPRAAGAGRVASYTLLARPAYAERIKLTDAQKAQVAAILAERAELLAKTPEAQRPGVVAQIEQKLAGVLTDEQRAQWLQVPPEPLLRFNFRYQKWIDVLEWLAKQAELSLVLDHPPEGTFNYVDTREFTPSEAIDLLNSVLLTKGYALVRRERMLIVVDLSEGLPENLVPRVTLEEADTRGRFELVTVAFPLGGRPVQAVEAEIKPLLGPHHKVASVGGQLIVTDIAGVMRDVQKAIQNVPVPVSKPTPPPAVPENPVAAAYPLKDADAETALKVLEAMLPKAKVVADAKTGQIHVYAPPSQQALAKGLLEQMQAGAPPEKKPRLELYPLDESLAKQVLASLEAIVPQAKVSYDEVQGRLVAWATAAEHETIKATLDKLAPAPSLETTRQFEVYRLTKVDPQAILPLLEKLLPRAKLAVDPTHRTLVAIATPADQKAIKNLLSQLQPDKPLPDSPELRFYQVKTSSIDNLVKVIERIVAKAQVTPDPAGKRLMVVASPADHELIKGMVEKYEKETPEAQKHKLVVYSVSTAQRKRFEAVLKTIMAELPGLQVLAETDPSELAIWARPDQHKVVAEVLEQLKAEVPAGEKYVLSAYPLKAWQAASIQTMLKTLHPNVQTVLDEKGHRLLVWAHPADQAAIKASLEQIQAPPPPERQQQIETYSLYGIDLTGLTAQLEKLVPEATIMVNSKTNRLIVWATPEDQEIVRKALEKLGRGSGVENTPQVETYLLTKADPSTVLALLQGLVPDAKLSVDPQSKRLVAVAVPADQKAIKALIDQLQAEAPADKQATFETYSVFGLDTTNLVANLQQAIPQAKFTLDTKTNRLVVWGTPTDQEAVKKALSKLGAAPAGQGAPALQVYRLTKADPTTVSGLLQSVVPAAKITVDPQTRLLIAIATAEDHKTIQNLLEQLQPEKPPPDAPELRFYPVAQPLPSSLLAAIQNLVPKAQISMDAAGKRLNVVATPADHEIIQSAVEQVQKVAGAEEKPKLVAYPVTPSEHKRLQAVLSSLSTDLPGVQVIADGEPGQVSIWARPSQHVVIAELLSQIKREVPGAEKNQVAVYPIKSADPKSVLSVLQTLFPNAQFVLDPRTRRIIVTAPASEQATIRTTIEKLDAGTPAETQDKLMIYPVPESDPATLIQILQGLVPEMKLSADPKGAGIVAWGRPEDHDLLARTLKDMLAGPAADFKPHLVVYPLAQGDPSAIAAVLKTLVPKATVAVDTKTGSLAATATRREHELIRAAIEQMSKKGPPETQPKMVIYTLDSVGPGGAAAVIPTLKSIFPDAQFLAGTEPDRLVVWARPAEHEAIQTAVSELGHRDPPDKARKVVVYTIKSASGPGTYYTYLMLQSMFPDAKFSLGTDMGKLIVWARPGDHEAIASAIRQMSEEDPPEKARRIVVYSLKAAGATGVSGMVSLLTSMFPDARFTLGTEPDTVIVWARPDDHKAIQAAIEQLGKEDPEKARKAVVYRLDPANPSGVYSALNVLTTMFPHAKFSVGVEPGTLVAWARPEEHDRIQQTVHQLVPPDNARKVVIYTLESASARASVATLNILRSMFPDAQFSIGSDMSKLIVWARPEDHKAIASAIQQMSEEDPPEKARRIVVYSLESAGPAGVSSAVSLLTPMFPDARFTPGPEPDTLIAWARPSDHKAIKAAIDQLGQEDPEKARRTAVYTLDSASPYGVSYAISILSTMFPQAKFTPGTEPGKLVAWARPAEHERIKETVAQLSQRDPPEKARRLATYTLQAQGRAGLANIISLLTSMFPDARFSAGTEPGKLVAWARPEDHKAIQAAIEELAKREPPGTARRMEVYHVESISAQAALPLLTAAFPDAEFSAGSEPGKIIAWARPADHEEIKKAVERLSRKGPPESEPVAAVYEVDSLGASGAMSLLRTAFPDAQLSVGADPTKLVVLARPAQQELIRTTIEAIEREAAKGQQARVQIYRMKVADPSQVLTVLQGLFRGRLGVQLSLDTRGEGIVAVASPAYQETIRTLIDQVEKAAAEDSDVRLQTYSLEDHDSFSILRVLNTVLEKQGAKAELSIDSRSNRLVAIARPEHHALIESTLKELRGEERHLEIFQLESVDVSTAELAINRLFSDGGYFRPASAPQVDGDETTQQLFIRATEKQFQKIRDLLVKMGETHLAAAGSAEGRRTRTLRFDGDLDEALQEIQRVWPQVRGNPIQVLKRPGPVSVHGRGTAEGTAGKGPATSAPSANGSAPKEEPRGWKPSPQGQTPGTSPPASPEADPSAPKPAGKTAKSNGARLHLVAASPELLLRRNEATPGDGWRASRPARTAVAADQAAAPAPAARPGSAPDEAAAPAPPAETSSAKPGTKPIMVIPGQGEVTITSEDPEALRQFEEMLRALAERRGTVGRNYSIYLLRNARAAEVASTLQRLFRTMPGGERRFGSAIVVPDERLNAVVVYANRTDRSTIEGLLKVLDSAEVPETLGSQRLTLIPIKNTNARYIARILQELYRTQSDAFSVEEATNSLVVMAQPALVEEIRQAAERLDEAAGSEAAQGTRIVPLQKTNSQRMQRALNILLHERPRYRGRQSQ